VFVDVKPVPIAKPNKKVSKSEKVDQGLRPEDQNSNLKRPKTIDLTDPDEGNCPVTKKFKSDPESFGSNADFAPTGSAGAAAAKREAYCPHACTTGCCRYGDEGK
jgi:hypothetical protein